MPTLLNLMIFLPLVAGIGCLLVPTKEQAKWLTLGTAIVVFVMSLIITAGYISGGMGLQFYNEVVWIDAINVKYATGVDGLSLPLVVLTTALSVLIVIASWKIEKSTKAFMAL